ncbi:hypothetical protein PAXRUDRAFT_772466 [Paxillus rubicundulus Ve08.2h10]|uniref:Uncharacterized protein n=1 Tax=Paxillus rubicundulus Ve08.2h10 TaxID=930991 RepID=A0A0D0DF79_9AGAM|nr:hypothetical protein PAXRUDRAFT_772466 [Paxillus rubicundulus Ve08.2h10]
MPKPRKVITFIINAMATSELKKPVMKCTSKSASFKFHHSNEPWDTLQAQLLAKISQLLAPNMINFNDYDVSFYISHTLSSQVEKMLLQAPTINIVVQQNPILAAVDISSDTRKENRGAEGDGDNDDARGANRKSKKKKDPAELPGNIKVSKNIQLFHDTWMCKRPNSTCPSSHCYVAPMGEHLHLSHEHLTCWAAVMLTGIEHTTLQKPPNHCLFGAVNQDGGITQEKLSPVLQHCLNNLESKNTSHSSALVINLSLSNNILGLAASQLP